MPDERYLKEIASELKLIRKELQRINRDPLDKIIANMSARLNNAADTAIQQIISHTPEEQ